MQTVTDIQSPSPEPPTGPPERGRAWRIIAIVLILHAALLGSVVLIQGCGKSESIKTAEGTPSTDFPETTTVAPKEKSITQITAATNPGTPSPNSEILTPEERLPDSETAEAPTPSRVTSLPASGQTQKIEQTHLSGPVSPPIAPVKATGVISKYTVKKGDTLTKIARKHNVSLRELVAVNKLTLKSRLKIGQPLVIPDAKSPEIVRTVDITKRVASVKTGFMREETAGSQIHQVKSGETPSSIAKRYGVSVQALLRINNIHDPRKVRVNQKLVIPVSKVVHETAVVTPAAFPKGREETNIHSTITEEPTAMGKEIKGV